MAKKANKIIKTNSRERKVKDKIRRAVKRFLKGEGCYIILSPLQYRLISAGDHTILYWSKLAYCKERLLKKRKYNKFIEVISQKKGSPDFFAVKLNDFFFVKIKEKSLSADQINWIKLAEKNGFKTAIVEAIKK